jgi:hypothetical protein
MVFPQAPGKSGLKPAFSLKSKVAVPKLKFWNSLTCHGKFISGRKILQDFRTRASCLPPAESMFL